MAGQHHSDFLALYMPKSPGKKRSIVMVRIKNVCVCSVLADGDGKCVCYRICVGGVSSCLLVFVSECVEIGVCLRNRVHNLAIAGARF